MQTVKRPFFSIVIPTYNRAHLIGKSIESVLNQTFSDFELIIVDDGSTDNTCEVVAGYNDSRIKYIYQKNTERSAARNNGIRNSLGLYVCFLDSDDYFLAERLKSLRGYIEKRGFPEVFIYTGKQNEINGVLYVANEYHGFKKEEFYLDNMITEIIHSQQVCVSTTILKRTFFNEHLSVSEDMELWLRIADKYEVVCLPNETSVVIVDHQERTVTKANYTRFFKQLAAIRTMFGTGHPGQRRVRFRTKQFMFSYVYFGIAKGYLSTGRRVMAVWFLIRSIISDVCNRQIKHRIYILLSSMNFFKTPQQVINLTEHENA